MQISRQTSKKLIGNHIAIGLVICVRKLTRKDWSIPRIGFIRDVVDTGLVSTMGTAVKPAMALDAVTNHLAAAVRAFGSE
jgi:hypothetical protein